MSKHKTLRRWIAVFLAVALLPIVPFQSFAADSTTERLNFDRSDNSPNIHFDAGIDADDELEDAPYADTDVVRVSIVVAGKSTLDAGFDAKTVATDSKAVAYRDALQAKQETVADKISAEVLDGKELDVVWNLTLAANIISANVEFGKIPAIKKVAGVKNVFVETQYQPAVVEKGELADPNMATSSSQIGTPFAWSAGFTGVGRKIAIIDTGIDLEHVSFNADAFEYSLAFQAGAAGYDDVDKYKEDMNLMTSDSIADVLEELNAFERGAEDVEKLYRNSKVPFAYNYIDMDFDVSHEHDEGSEHGSHVSGIAAANAYVKKEGGGFEKALSSVMVQGVAPDAQIVTMKVFGKGGGAYDSDYFAAIEDAIVLGCDSANLSLGSVNPGWSNSTTYYELLDELTTKGLVMVTSTGNSGNWADYTNPWYDPTANAYQGYLYGDDVSFHTGGSPGSFAQTFGVASVENAGTTGLFIYVNDEPIVYSETDYSNTPFTQAYGGKDLQFVYIDDVGSEEQFAEIEDLIKGKVAVCNRGTTSFYEKANAAANHGAAAVIIVNNQPGVINMDLTDYTGTAPVVSITQADGALLKTNKTTREGTEVTEYYTGTITIGDKLDYTLYGDEFYTMSEYSSWGVPQSLTMKPEITAPGGSIYSVNGSHAGDGANVGQHDQYEMMSGTSMAAPQVTGMVALVDQFLEQNGYTEQEGLTLRKLALSLLMSTAVPMEEGFDGENSAGLSHYYYPVLRQGAGLANVGNAVSALSYILMNADATKSYADGKVKAELGANKDGKFSYSFTLNNLNGKENTYTLSTDLFTQDLFEASGELLLDTWTTPLTADVVYTVDGVEFVPKAAVVADVNLDGVTDAKDACAILDLAVEKLAEDAEGYDFDVADLDGDGSVTTYDAYLILSNMETEAFAVPANDSVEIEVSITVDPDAVADYENGAYVEGYTFVSPVSGEDGLLDVTHSIPILGFYGDWSDPSMYDQNSYIESLYGNDRVPYVAPSQLTGTVDGRTVYQTNYLSYTDQYGDNYIFMGNPYGIEDEFPADKAALNSASIIYQLGFSLIRNAAVMGYVIKDADTDEVLYASNPTSYGQYNVSAYFNSNTGAWGNTAITLTANRKLTSLPSVKNGTTKRVTVSFVAVPEYYITDDMIAETETEAAYEITADELLEVIPKLGKGSFLSTTFKIDDEAPELLGATKNLLNGDLTITASDNEDIAVIAVLNRSGSKVYDMKLAPELDEKGNATYTIEAAKYGIGSKCTILVADYAGNESTFTVEYGGEDPDYSGKMFAFVGTNMAFAATDLNHAWVNIDPATVSYTYMTDAHTGMTVESTMNAWVTAADYVEGYVFFTVGTDLYVSEMLDLSYPTYVGDLSESGITSVEDLAYSKSEGKLYAMCQDNTVYTIDMLEGTAELAFEIKNDISSASAARMRSFTVDEDGNFYSATYFVSSATNPSRLFTWTLDDVVDKTLSLTVEEDAVPLTAVNDTVRECGGSMEWDSNTNTLYLASSYYNRNASGYTTGYMNNYLWKVDPETGVCEHANSATGTVADGNLYFAARGLFVVPGKSASGPDFGETTKVSSLTLSEEEVELLVGGTAAIDYRITPWTLSDKTVSWSTKDAKVATVDENGVITAVGEGTTTITATANADSKTTAEVKVTVKPLPEMTFSAIIYDDDSKAYHAQYTTNAPEDWTKFEGIEGSDIPFVGGTLVDDLLYVYDLDGNLYEIDADTFETKELGQVDWPITDAAAVPTFVEYGFYYVYSTQNFILLGQPYNIAENNEGMGWDMSSYIATGDSIVALAYAGTEEFADADSGVADHVYILTEQGDLWSLYFFDGSTMSREELGVVDGVNLTGVSDADGSSYASLAYSKDEDGTEYLVLTSYIDGVDEDAAKVQLIDLDARKVVGGAKFDENVWPVIVNYNHDRITDLALKLDKTAVSLYEGFSTTVNAKVKLYEEDDSVTWSTSDSNVATVVDGKITGVGEGTATITATTVETNDKGDHVTATVEVTVKGRTELDTDSSVGGQLSDGTWVDIPLGDPSTYESFGATAGTIFTGGGFGGDGLYGSDADVNGDKTASGTFYMVDSDLDVTEGSQVTTFYAPVDLTYAPKLTVEIDGQEYDAFDAPMYIPVDSKTPTSIYWLLLGMEDPGRGMYMLNDLTEAMISGMSDLSTITSTGNMASAVAFGGTADWKLMVTPSLAAQIEAENPADTAEIFYVLNADTLYFVMWIPCLDAETEELTYISLTGVYGELSAQFPDDTAVSMDLVDLGSGNYDLVISYNTEGSSLLFRIDLDSEEEVLPVDYIGCIQSSSLTSLFFNGNGEESLFSVANNSSVLDRFASSDAVLSSTTTISTAAVEAPATFSAVSSNVMTIEAFKGTPKAAAGTLNNVEVPTAEEEAEEPATYTVDVTADEAVNGLYTVEYDAALLTLVSVDGKTEFFSHNETETGKVKLAFASVDALNGVVATLKFAAKTVSDEDVTTDVTITTGETEEPATETVEVTIAGKGHDYGEPTFTWSDDNASASATFSCANDDDTVTVPATVTSEVTKAATCTEAGTTTYTATVEFEGKTYTDTKSVENVPATGHTEETVPGKPATCTEDGLTDGTKCSVCGKTLKAQEVIPATGHTEEKVPG